MLNICTSYLLLLIVVLIGVLGGFFVHNELACVLHESTGRALDGQIKATATATTQPTASS